MQRLAPALSSVHWVWSWPTVTFLWPGKPVIGLLVLTSLPNHPLPMAGYQLRFKNLDDINLSCLQVMNGFSFARGGATGLRR